jgi:O-antigen/teichoic acid export membrane protein
MAGRRLSLGRNSVINLSARTLGLLLGLLVTPYVVTRLGLRVFGFAALVTALSQYASLLDFGVGFTLARFIAKLDAEGDHEMVRRNAAAGLWSSTVFAAVIFAIVLAVVLALPHHLTRSWPPGWQLTALAVALSLGTTSMSSVFQAFPSGMGRWDLANLQVVIGQVTYAVVIVVALHFEPTLKAVALATAASGVAGLAVAYIVYRVRWGHRLWPTLVRLGEVGELWRYGLSVQTVNLVQIINAQADKPILLLFASLKFVGLYELGSRVAFSIRALALTAFGPLGVESARRLAEGGREGLADFYVRSYRTVMSLGLAPIVALYGVSYVFILLWVGPGLRTAGVIALILGTGYAVNLATGVGTALAMGGGRPDLDRNYSALGLVLNLALTLALGFTVGRWGVVVATALGLMISSGWLLYTVDRWLGTPIFSLRGIWGSATAVALLVVAVEVGVAATLIAILVPVSSRLVAAAVIAAALGIFALFWLTECHRAGLINLERFSLRSRVRTRTPL